MQLAQSAKSRYKQSSSEESSPEEDDGDLNDRVQIEVDSMCTPRKALQQLEAPKILMSGASIN